MLKPLIKSLPYIIHGTKDLAIQLSKLSVPFAKSDGFILKRLYLVSGDVVAFYPNIDVQKAHHFALNKLSFWIADNGHPDIIDESGNNEIYGHYMWLFRECLEVANNNLLCKFQGKVYKQLRGLAMGVASSPDLANLYGTTFELAAMGMPHSRADTCPEIAFYGRYIDDIIALVYAESEDEAVDYMSNLIRFDNCTITWSGSDKFMTFLDMTLFFDEEGALQHKAYRKPLNHFERIPWVSAHPLYVKRGTFVSELSRIATLSSRYEDYVNACKEVCDIYIARGYPPDVIHSWLRSNYKVRWEQKLRDGFIQTSSDVLVLKSEYNTSWDYFNVQTLSEQIKTGWKVALRTLSFGHEYTDHESPMHPDVLATRPNASLLRDVVRQRWSVPREVHVSALGHGLGGMFLRLDKLGLLDKRLLVGKRRTKQLIDLCASWRLSVLKHRDQLSHPDDFDNWDESVLRPLKQTTIDAWLRRSTPPLVEAHLRTPSPDRRALAALADAYRL
jgi:hypothetical protein